MAPYLALGRGERQKYIAKLSKQTDLSDNSLRRMIAAAQFLEAEGITDLPPGGRLPLGAVENIARIAAHEPSRRRDLLDWVRGGEMTVVELQRELDKTRRAARRRANDQESRDSDLRSLAEKELKARKFDSEVMKVSRFDDVGDLRYFDSQTRPVLVIQIRNEPDILVMDGSQTGGTSASFMRQRKEFMRNILVAAGLYEMVLVYAPHWGEDVHQLIHQTGSTVRDRIIQLGVPRIRTDPLT